MRLITGVPEAGHAASHTIRDMTSGATPVPSLLVRRWRNVGQLLSLFRSPVELAKCARVVLGRAGAAPVRLRLRILGGFSVLCRPGTTDFGTLLSVFAAGYHLPPVPVLSGGVIVDLGSNVGYTLVDFAKRFPGTRLIGVELDEENCRVALATLSLAGVSCDLLHAAVWTSDGTISYGVAAADAFSVANSGGGTLEAPAITLPTLLERCNLESVDYLKVDIEGAEREIFSGPLGWAAKVKSMKIEIHRQEDFAVIEQRLRGVGFSTRKDSAHWSAIVAERN